MGVGPTTANSRFRSVSYAYDSVVWRGLAASWDVAPHGLGLAPWGGFAIGCSRNTICSPTQLKIILKFIHIYVFDMLWARLGWQRCRRWPPPPRKGLSRMDRVQRRLQPQRNL